MRALFIHRSVGQNLIIEGGLRQFLQARNVELDDYDNNSGILTYSDGVIAPHSITIPGNNTNPNNLAQYFSNWDGILGDYDLIVIKSCYPNSHINNKSQYEAVQNSYKTIFAEFKSHQKQLILLTSPPLRPLLTNRSEVEWVNKLNVWLLSSANKYVHVFDLHALLAEPNGRHAGMLRKDYRRLLPFDNHPNKKANQEIASLVADFIAGN